MIYRSVWKDFSNWFLFVNYWTVWSLRTLVRLLKHAPRYFNTRIVDASRLRDTEEQDNNGVTFPEFIHYYTDNDITSRPTLATIWKAVPSVLNWLRFYWSLWDSVEDAALLLKVTGLENRATFPPIRNSKDSNELWKYFSKVPAKDIIGIGKSIAVTLKYLVTITSVLWRNFSSLSIRRFWGKGGKILARPDTQVRTSGPLLVHLSLSCKIYWSFL